MLKFFVGLMHGVLIAVLISLYVLAAHEDELFDDIVASALNESMSDQEAAIELVTTTHELLRANFSVLSKTPNVSFRQKYINSSDIQLASPKGHCGSYAHVLARLLQRANFDVRMVQMDCSNGQKSCHILVEAMVDEQFRVLDAMYNLSFMKDESLAAFSEVSENWSFYSQQLPQGYPKYFDYHQARYTNWNKIPVLMPALKKVLSWFIGSKVNKISLRAYFLNVYKAYFFILVGLYIFTVFCFLIFFPKRNRAL